MNKKLPQILFVLFVLFGNSLYAQLPSGFTNNAPCSLNPPANTSTWDWRGSTPYTFYLQGNYTNPVSVPSPWYASENPSADYNNPNINDFDLQNPKDYEPTDGWVLVRQEFGSPGNPINHPYFILYNTNTAVLRVFVAITTVIGQNTSAVISLTYGSGGATAVKRTALFEHYSPTINNPPGFTFTTGEGTLNGFNNNVAEVDVPNTYGFDLPYWLHADFTMNYDPCTCNSLSQLYFDVKLVSSSALTFTLNGQAVQQPGSQSGGIANSLSGAKPALGIIQGFAAALPAVTSILSLASGDGEIIAGIGILGKILGLSSFLTGFANAPPAAPMVFNINLTANGTITEDAGHKQIIIENPGSNDKTLVPPTAIVYNNPMGVFNLLSKPTIVWGRSNAPNGIAYTMFKITSPPQFVINPAVSYSKADVRAALVFDYGARTVNVAGQDYNHMLLQESPTILRTRFLPISVVGHYPYVVSLYTMASSLHPEFPDCNVSFQVLVTFTLNNGNTLIYSSKYAVNFQQVADNTLETTNWQPFTADDIVVPSGTTATTDLYAWNSVTIQDGASVYNDPNADNNAQVVAGYQINLPASWTGSNLPYWIDFHNCSQEGVYPAVVYVVETPASATSVQSTCTSTTYTSLANQYISSVKRQDSVAIPNRLNPAGVTALGSAFPNPSAKELTIPYSLARGGVVNIYVTNLSGQRVLSIVNNQEMMPGNYQATVSIYDLPSGIYFYTMEQQGFRQTKKLIIAKD